MKATISLSGLLLAEILAIICGYFYGYNFKNSISIFFLFTAFLPVTAFLLFTTSFGVDDEGKLRRDTFGFKILSALRPEVLKEDKLYICPTFWGMVLLMVGFSILFVLVALMGCHLIDQFPLIAKIIVNCISFFVPSAIYIFMASYICVRVGKKTEGNIWREPIHYGFIAFFVALPIFSLYCVNLPEINYYSLLLISVVVASGLSLSVYLGLFTVHCMPKLIVAVLRSPPVRYVVAFHNKTCPVVEISSEGKVPTPTPVLTEPESKEPGSP